MVMHMGDDRWYAGHDRWYAAERKREADLEAMEKRAEAMQRQMVSIMEALSVRGGKRPMDEETRESIIATATREAMADPERYGLL